MKRKSFAKVNIFLKIAGKRDNYHELVSRFVIVKNLYDEVEFIQESKETFTLEGNFSCALKSNTIYKAYLAMCKESLKVKEYFDTHFVKVNKKIPEFAGLGGGSSNCASFILMVNEVCSLNLSKNKLAKIAISIGADVPFFIYEYNSANVTGIGEIVEEFKEEDLNIETITPKIKCDTGKIFSRFRKSYYKEISDSDAKNFLEKKSLAIINEYNIYEANDLYAPSLSLNSKLSEFEKPSWFFSGSGSSFFKVIN